MMTLQATGRMELLSMRGENYMKGGLGERDNQEPGFVYAKFQMQIWNTSGNIKSLAVVWVWTRVVHWESDTYDNI